MLWGDKRYHSWNYHLRQVFGQKVFKVALDAGLTCPNRDGQKGTGGCIFCSARGSGDFAGEASFDLLAQFIQIRQQQHKKWPNAKYIAYFQAYTNTYAPVEQLRQNFHAILGEEGVVGISISTRPDCLSPEVLELLTELNQKTYLWVELGLQSKHNRTLELINRGHTYEEFLAAVEQLKERRIRTCAHIILGLPGETEDDMMATAKTIADLQVEGIKLHLLHLMKNTPMVQLYEEGNLIFLDQQTYTRLVVDILAILPPEMVIHRLTGDAPRDTIIGPLWSLKKWEVLNGIDDELKKRDTWQGKYWVGT